MDGSSSLTAVCNDSAWNTDPNPGSGSVEASDAKSAHGVSTAKSPPRDRLLLDDDANGTLFQTFCNNDGDEDVLEAGWRWGVGGATFALGELSRIRLASDALLDGLWSPVREGYSTASEEGQITASVEVFETRAIYSALLFYDDVEFTQEGSTTDNTRTSKLGAEGIPSFVCTGVKRRVGTHGEIFLLTPLKMHPRFLGSNYLDLVGWMFCSRERVKARVD